MKQFFTEDNGNFSFMRLAVFIVLITVLFNWTWFNIKHGTIISFDWQEMLLIIGPLFLKGYQKGKEGGKSQ
ncbi:hypothetical protein LCGC14_2504490 [marine sediment metagenome]|uniref:Uncharacterized protein n=1 Tax=marine sediment metagenome TaxID=412755 RepID=A0A0F9BNY0_9ZZZZ